MNGEQYERNLQLEGRLTKVEEKVSRLDYEIFNGGQKGLSTKVDDLVLKVENFMTDHTTRETMLASRRRVWQWRIGIGATIASAILAVVVTWLLTMLVPAVRAIMDDYYVHHPTAQVTSLPESYEARR